MGQKAKRNRLAVSAFYSFVGFLLSICLLATCQFVERRLVLSYTKRPTAAPTGSPSTVPSAAPSVFVPPPTANSTNGTAPAPTFPTAASIENGGGGESPATVGGGATSARPTVSDTAAPTAIVDNNGIRKRRLQNDTSAPTLPPPPSASQPAVAPPTNTTSTSQPTTVDQEIIGELEERFAHKVGFWDWEITDGNFTACVPYKVCIETTACYSPNFDSAFNAARTFALFAAMLGGVATLVILAGLCFPFNPWYLAPVYAVLMLCQGLSLLVYRSEICEVLGDVDFWLSGGGVNLDDVGDYTGNIQELEAYLTSNTEVTCHNGAGSKMAISATIMWFLAAITCYWNVKRTRDI